MKNLVFKKDLYRCYGDSGEPLKRKIFRCLELKYLCTLRKAQACKNSLGKFYYRLRLRRLSMKSQIQIQPSVKIGEGFYIAHLGRIIINPRVTIGKNVNISTGVVIGQENRGKRVGVPTIGNECWIGANAVIVGNITIGNDVLIAPLAFVNFDVPDHSIVVGNPAKIISRENATEGYLKNLV